MHSSSELSLLTVAIPHEQRCCCPPASTALESCSAAGWAACSAAPPEPSTAFDSCSVAAWDAAGPSPSAAPPLVVLSRVDVARIASSIALLASGTGSAGASGKGAGAVAGGRGGVGGAAAATKLAAQHYSMVLFCMAGMCALSCWRAWQHTMRATARKPRRS